MSVGIQARTPATILRKVWEIVSGQHATTFLIISANRGDQPTAVNQRNDAELRDILRKLGRRMVPLSGLGQEWAEGLNMPVATREKSYLVAGVSRAQAEALCRKFNQDAFVFGQDGATKLIRWDKQADAMETVMDLGSIVLHRGKTYDPTTHAYHPDTPGSATFRSDGAGTKGVGFTFYSEEGVVDEIHEAARRLKAAGKITESPSVVQRMWMDLATRAERKVQELVEAGRGGVEEIQGRWKRMVREAARDPEGMVLTLVGAHAEVGV